MNWDQAGPSDKALRDAAHILKDSRTILALLRARVTAGMLNRLVDPFISHSLEADWDIENAEDVRQAFACISNELATKGRIAVNRVTCNEHRRDSDCQTSPKRLSSRKYRAEAVALKLPPQPKVTGSNPVGDT